MKNADMPVMPHSVVGPYGGNLTTPGLSKREYFAGLAMQGDFAAQDCQVGEFMTGHAEDLRERAVTWVDAADALLSELENESQQNMKAAAEDMYQLLTQLRGEFNCGCGHPRCSREAQQREIDELLARARGERVSNL